MSSYELSDSDPQPSDKWELGCFLLLIAACVAYGLLNAAGCVPS